MGHSSQVEPAVSDLIAGCGGSSLGAEPPPEAVEAFLRDLADQVAACDPIRRETLRAEAVRCLRAANLPRSDALVGAAFPRADSRARDTSARGPALQGQAIECEDPEPWPDPVDGADLLAELARTLARFVVMPDGATTAVALWILVSHAQDAFSLLPVLNISSPVKGCGKSTLVDLLAALVRRPLKADNVSASALFRAIETKRPTMLLDEGDAWMDLKDELRGILNAGYTRSGRVLRCAGDSQEVRAFSAFCPKVMAGIGARAATIVDRSITVELQKAARGERLERLRRDRLERGELEHLRRMALRWAVDHQEDLFDGDPELPPELTDRPADNWRPLVAVADAAGGEWPERARRAARLLTGTLSREEDVSILLLEDLQDLFRGREGPLASHEIVEALGAMEDRPWSEWRNGKALTPAALARLLKRYRIGPREQRYGPGPNERLRGYCAADFADAFRRYLSEVRQPRQTSNGADSPPSAGCDSAPLCRTFEPHQNPHHASDVAAVALRSRGDGALGDLFAEPDP